MAAERRCSCGHLARFHRKQWPVDCSVCIRRYGRSDDICDGKVHDDDD